MPTTQIQVLELWTNAKKGLGDVDKLYEQAVKLCESEEDAREKQFASQTLRRFHRWMLVSPRAPK
jgi:hypothetical protein